MVEYIRRQLVWLVGYLLRWCCSTSGAFYFFLIFSAIKAIAKINKIPKNTPAASPQINSGMYISSPFLNRSSGILKCFDVIFRNSIFLPNLNRWKFFLTNPVPDCNNLDAVSFSNFFAGIHFWQIIISLHF